MRFHIIFVLTLSLFRSFISGSVQVYGDGEGDGEIFEDVNVAGSIDDDGDTDEDGDRNAAKGWTP